MWNLERFRLGNEVNGELTGRGSIWSVSSASEIPHPRYFSSKGFMST